MAESPAARRERIAETIYAAMIASPAWCDNTNADLAWEARKAADAFLSSAPERPHPPADGYPTLLTREERAFGKQTDMREEARRG